MEWKTFCEVLHLETPCCSTFTPNFQFFAAAIITWWSTIGNMAFCKEMSFISSDCIVLFMERRLPFVGEVGRISALSSLLRAKQFQELFQGIFIIARSLCLELEKDIICLDLISRFRMSSCAHVCSYLHVQQEGFLFGLEQMDMLQKAAAIDFLKVLLRYMYILLPEQASCYSAVSWYLQCRQMILCLMWYVIWSIPGISIPLWTSFWIY